MRKYTKKEQSFITDNYPFDLEKLIPYIEFTSSENQKRLNLVVKYARELINGNTRNTAVMFSISEKLYEELLDIFNDLCELSNEDKLPENQQDYFEHISGLNDHLQILNNLHPDSILTWEDVADGYI